MKITKQELVSLIEQELKEFDNSEKVSTADVRKTAAADAKQKTAGGVTDTERGIIQKLQSQLIDASKSGNIASGRVIKLAKLLSAELLKMSQGNPEQEEEEQ